MYEYQFGAVVALGLSLNGVLAPKSLWVNSNGEHPKENARHIEPTAPL